MSTTTTTTTTTKNVSMSQLISADAIHIFNHVRKQKRQIVSNLVSKESEEFCINNNIDKASDTADVIRYIMKLEKDSENLSLLKNILK